MSLSLAAKRYAKALYKITKEKGTVEPTLAELKKVNTALFGEPKTQEFIESPIVSLAEKKQALTAAVKPSVSEPVFNLLLLMADKGRLSLIPNMVEGFVKYGDLDAGVCRGTVISARTLTAEERKSIEQSVSVKTKKKVILDYKEDASILGGTKVNVDGWTFDDSISSHITRLNEELNRRSN